MFNLNRQPTLVSAKDFVRSLLTGDYRWKYPQAGALVKILLANEFLLEPVKRELKLDRNFVRENINNLNSVCKDPNIARLAAWVIDHKSFDFYNFSFLFEQASQSKSEDSVVNLLRYNSDLKLDMKDTLLHAAAKNGLANVCRVLAERGLDVNSKDEHGWTPLHWAAWYGHLEVAKVLLRHRADVNAKDKDYDRTPLHWAAYKGYSEVAQVLLAHSADVNAKDTYDRTPLHWAAYKGYSEVAQVLLAHSADVNAKDKDGWTPLHKAAENGQLEIIEVLLACGANVSAKNERGKTPLDVASNNTREAIKQYLENQQKMTDMLPLNP
jgi:ankyrin repeat protein